MRHTCWSVASVIESYIRGVKAEFLASPMMEDTVLRNLQVMAESSQRLSETTITAHPQIDWCGMSGFRNVVVHDYLGVDTELIWAVIEHDLPPLRADWQRC